MVQSVVYLSFYCIFRERLILVNSLELNGHHDPIDSRNYFLLTFSTVQSSKRLGTPPGTIIKNRPDHDSYVGTPKPGTTGGDIPETETISQVDLERISSDDKYCHLLCSEFGYFPININNEEVFDTDKARFQVHMDFVELATTDPIAVMKACNDATKALCMREILIQKESETLPDFEPDESENKPEESETVIDVKPEGSETVPDGKSDWGKVSEAETASSKSKNGPKTWVWIVVAALAVWILVLIGLCVYFFSTKRYIH
ncbi:hypothetical protein RF11_00907 [Thelohanellus kitauei]|uniref:Uncharacterized protein n=1 Tax=Thelohanellus kitauei TaxID=669202 RepID=A0A0C2MEJ9_THEKT|nr:hypothetical protein RF11_00907 [Thelohanellus kitauei]